jgi:L-threonylcarbamoyladenylate synthase
MLILRIDPKKPDAAALKKAAAVLKAGGLVVYPTETAYALGCDPKNPKAVKRLFSVKKRDAAKRLPMIAATAAMAMRHLKLDRYGRILARAFWPGPLTIVAPVAMRVSPHPVAAALSRALGRPVASTSANRSGQGTAYDVPSILKDLGASPDLVLDAGPLKKAPVSTIVRPGGGIIEVLRAGAVTEEDLHTALMRNL